MSQFMPTLWLHRHKVPGQIPEKLVRLTANHSVEVTLKRCQFGSDLYSLNAGLSGADSIRQDTKGSLKLAFLVLAIPDNLPRL